MVANISTGSYEFNMNPASLQSTRGYAVAGDPLLFCGTECGTAGEKKKKETVVRLVKNHSDVFMATSSILKKRAVERMRQKWKIAAFVVPVVPKKGMFCVAEDSRQVWFAAVESPRTESAFAALPMLT